jgi:hypothetical protein
MPTFTDEEFADPPLDALKCLLGVLDGGDRPLVVGLDDRECS